MEDGQRYVVYSQNILYYLPNASCSEGSSIVLNNTPYTVVYNVNGNWLKGSSGTTSSYSSNSYICHVWNNSQSYNQNYLVLPAVLVVLAFFSVIFHWFLRLRG